MKKRPNIWEHALTVLLALIIFTQMMMPAQIEVKAATNKEYKAVWLSYYDFENYLDRTAKNNTAYFTKFFTKVAANCKKNGFNTIIVHVHPFGDALYRSKYFPTAACIAGKQGKSLSYDPLMIMVNVAHAAGLKIEAWLNPYRVAFGTSYKKLAKTNPARKWHASSKASTRRNVLSYNGNLYYNPAKAEVRQLIINGVKEIVRNYNVDGIHLDDYFYPSFTASNYKKAFDAKEYNASKDKKNGKTIIYWRRKQVNTLVKGIYKAVKSVRKNCSFGISPAGNIDNLTSKYAYYVDIKNWTTKSGYVDYIAPQIYWGFKNKYAPFEKVLKRWINMVDQKKVRLFVGLPAYRMGQVSSGSTSGEKKELKSATTLKKMTQYVNKYGGDGIILFDYEDIGKTAVRTLATYLKSTKLFR